MTKNYLYLVLALFLFNFQTVFSQNAVWYVSENGTGNGTSWSLASNNLQNIINNAVAGDQVWVKQGTYQRNVGLSFSVKDGVSVYGGFPSAGNPTMNNRNPRLYETILSGNQARVLEASGSFDPISTSTIIDGFTIKNGNANVGAGILGYNCDATFRNLKIVNNSSNIGMGGGVSLGNSNSTFIQVVIANNTSLLSPGSDGDIAGIRINGGSPRFYNSVIANNHAEGYTGGVGLYSTNTYFYNTVIYGNTADLHYPSSPNDNFFNGQNGVANSSNCILQGCRGSDFLFQNVQFAIYGNDLGGNLDVNPLFNADYSIQAVAGINKGNTQAYQSAVNSFAKDYYNNNRIVDVIDIGLTEHQAVQSETLYVKQNGTGDGSSWANASGDLQQMMDKQFPGKSVWVAAGMYSASAPYFRLRDKVKVYGGFPATGNPTFNDRNAEANPTILTSSTTIIIGNFYPDDKKLSSETLLDGFVITKNANSPVNMLGVFESNSEASYSNVTFRELSYGAVKIWNGTNTSYTDCKFLDNISLHHDYPTVFMHMGAHASFENCDFTGNKAFTGSAVYLKNNSFARMDSCLFSTNNNNYISGAGKVVALENSSATITNSTFEANGDNSHEGAVLTVSGYVDPYVAEWTHAVNVIVDRCSFTNNLNRGLLYSGRSTDKASISNSLFYRNQGGSGGAISKALDGDFYINNCTITENYASNQVAGGIYIGEGSGNNYIRNSIIYNNSAIYSYTPEVWAYAPVRFQNTLIRTSGGSTNWNAGAFNNYDMAPMAIDMGGNLDANPLFVDAVNGNYHLSANSPAKNSGNNAFYNSNMTPNLSMFTNDLDGLPRIQDSVVDMGAYEFSVVLGLDPVEVTSKISVYPNPTQDLVHIRSSDLLVKEVKVYSILGKELITISNDEVNLSELPKGIYLLKVVLDSDERYTVKVVKE